MLYLDANKTLEAPASSTEGIPDTVAITST